MKISWTEIRWYLVALLVTGIALLLFLGKAPLFLEEPRRALITLEMLRSGNPWAMTQLGEWYYYKPPFYNWILAPFALIGNGFEEFFLRLPTVLATLAIAFLLFQSGKKWVDTSFGLNAAFFFVTFSGILYYFSMLAEIDLVYALIAFSSILVIFEFGEKNQHWKVFLLAYLLCAVGVLTKGLPSFAFTAISLLVYYVDRKQFIRLVQLPHIVGILLLITLLGGYVWKYSQFNDPIFLLETLVGESSERTMAGHTLGEFLWHLLQFPIDWILDLMPGALVILFLIRRDWKHLLLQRNPFIRFSVWMLFFNILLYWTAPGTRMRYVYPLYPFAAILLAWGWQHRKEAALWAYPFYKGSMRFLFILIAVGCLALPFIPDLAFLPWRYPLALGGAGFFAGLFWYSRQAEKYLLPLVFIALAVGRIVFDLSVLPQRTREGDAAENQKLAKEIYQHTGQAALYFYGEPKVISYTTTFYLDRMRKKPVVLQDQLQRGQFYLLPKHLASPYDSILLTTTYNDTTKVLILKR